MTSFGAAAAAAAVQAYLRRRLAAALGPDQGEASASDAGLADPADPAGPGDAAGDSVAIGPEDVPEGEPAEPRRWRNPATAGDAAAGDRGPAPGSRVRGREGHLAPHTCVCARPHTHTSAPHPPFSPQQG